MPASQNGVKNSIMSFGKKAKAKLREEICERKQEGQRFSVSFDEWTSKRNRRYLCLNLHTQEGAVIGLGTVRVKGSLPAEATASCVEEKLLHFGLEMKRDILGAVTDGASVMKKTGRIMGTEHQLCHSHGLHLAVCQVLYKSGPRIQKEEEAEDFEEEEEEREEQDDEEGEDEEESEEEVAGYFQEPIRKVRRIVTLFRKSPVRNDLLQDMCEQECGKRLVLLRDTKTRWNSLLLMIKRFLEAKKAVAKALVDLGKIHLYPEKEELAALEEMAEALDIVQTGSLALGRRDANLSKAEVIFDFMLQNLRSLDTKVCLCNAFEKLAYRYIQKLFPPRLSL